MRWLWRDFAFNPHHIPARKALLPIFYSLRDQGLGRVSDLPPITQQIGRRARPGATASVPLPSVFLLPLDRSRKEAEHPWQVAQNKQGHRPQVLPPRPIADCSSFPWQNFTDPCNVPGTKHTQLLLPWRRAEQAPHPQLRRKGQGETRCSEDSNRRPSPGLGV